MLRFSFLFFFFSQLRFYLILVVDAGCLQWKSYNLVLVIGVLLRWDLFVWTGMKLDRWKWPWLWSLVDERTKRGSGWDDASRNKVLRRCNMRFPGLSWGSKWFLNNWLPKGQVPLRFTWESLIIGPIRMILSSDRPNEPNIPYPSTNVIIRYKSIIQIDPNSQGQESPTTISDPTPAITSNING